MECFPQGKVVTIIRSLETIVDSVFSSFMRLRSPHLFVPPSSSFLPQETSLFIFNDSLAFDGFITDHDLLDSVMLDCWRLNWSKRIFFFLTVSSRDVALKLYNVHHHAV